MQIFSNDILLNLEQIKKDYEHLCELLTYEEILIDNKLCLKYQKQLENIEPIYKKYQTFLNLQQQLKQLYISADIVSEQEAELYKQEQQDLSQKITNLQKEILKLLDNQNAKLQKITIEVMSGSKNSTEQLKNDIVLAYQNFCKQNNLDFQIKNIEQNTIFDICGFNAKKFFNKESGLHVLSNKQSICKVFVYDSFDIIEPVFDEQDIKIEICRSSGAGGQHINTTDSAIKITHLSTGITAVCQDERSQFQNKQKALENLKVKVFDFYKKQKSTFIENQKKEQVKLINKNYVVKIYDYDCKIIISKIDNKKITLDDFLSGHDL